MDCGVSASIVSRIGQTEGPQINKSWGTSSGTFWLLCITALCKMYELDYENCTSC